MELKCLGHFQRIYEIWMASLTIYLIFDILLSTNSYIAILFFLCRYIMMTDNYYLYFYFLPHKIIES